MADYGQGFMVCMHFCQAHLQEVGLTQNPANHDNQTIVIGCHGYLNRGSLLL